MHSQKQILLMIVLAALVMRGPINAVGPMAPVVRDVFDLPWEAFGVLAGIPTMAFGLCSLAVLPLVAGFGSRTFAVAALTGAALGSFVRCIEWMPALFLGTLILSVSIAGLNVWVPSVIKVVFHDRQSQVMGVYTAVLSISGLLGTASVMPALEAGGVWWGSFCSLGIGGSCAACLGSGFWRRSSARSGTEGKASREERSSRCTSRVVRCYSGGAHLHRCVDDALRA